MTRLDDSADLARFGYRQELDRSLGSFSSFAAGFSYTSILTGLSHLRLWWPTSTGSDLLLVS